MSSPPLDTRAKRSVLPVRFFSARSIALGDGESKKESIVFVRVRSALSLRDGKAVLARKGCILFQTGNSLVEYNYVFQQQAVITFTEAARLDAWDVNVPRSMLACSLRGEGKSSIAIFDYDTLALIGEFQEADDGCAGKDLVFSRCGFRLLSAESFPFQDVRAWSLGEIPTDLEPDKRKLTPILLKKISLNEQSEFASFSFNPNDQQEFVVFSSTKIEKHKICTDHGAERHTSTRYYDLDTLPKDKTFLERISCHTWGPDNVIYCGMDSGEVLGLKPKEAKVEGNSRYVDLSAPNFSFNSATPAKYHHLINLLKYDMMEPSTGLYSHHDVSGIINAGEQIRPAEASENIQQVFATSSNSGKEKEIEGISSMRVVGSHLLVATSKERILVFEFLSTARGSQEGVVLSKLKGVFKQSCQTEVLVNLIEDSENKMMISLSQNGTVRCCSTELLSSECAKMQGGPAASIPLGLTSVQHFFVYDGGVSKTPAYLDTLKGLFAAFLLSQNRFLLASEGGELRLMNHKTTLKTFSMPCGLIPPSGNIIEAVLGIDEDDDPDKSNTVRHSDLRNKVSIGKKGAWAAIGCSNGVVNIFDFTDNHICPVFSIRLHECAVEWVCFDFGSERLASAAHDGTIVISNIDLLRPVARVQINEIGTPLCGSWLGCGKFVVAYELGKIAVSDQKLENLTVHETQTEACEVLTSPDNFSPTQFSLVMKDGGLRLFDIANSKNLELVREDGGLTFTPTCAALSPKASLVAIGGENGEISVRSLASEKFRISYWAHDPLPDYMIQDLTDTRAASAGTTSLEFAKEGPSLLTYGASNGVILWDLSGIVEEKNNWWKLRETEEYEDTEFEAESNNDEYVNEAAYCPLTMGGPLCISKADREGFCSDCGTCVQPLAAEEEFTSMGTEYCPLSLGAPKCKEFAKDGICSQCGIEVSVEVKLPEEKTARSKNLLPVVELSLGAEEPAKIAMTLANSSEGSSDSVRQRLAKLKQSLDGLIKTNATVDEMEQLPREDFIIDISMKNELVKKGEVGAENERKRILREVKERELIAFRITEMTREAFSTERLVIEPFREALPAVSNFPIPKPSLAEVSRAQKIAHLRKISALERRFMLHKLNDQIGAVGSGSPIVSPWRSPAVSPSAGMGGFSSDNAFIFETGWPASKMEWETIGVLNEDPLTVASKYVIDANLERLEKEAQFLREHFKYIWKKREDTAAEQEAKNTRKDDKEENKVDWRSLSLGEIPDDDVKNILQHPLACCTRFRKVIQAHAIQVRSRKLASEYNKVFERMYREKQICYEMVLEKTRRIMDVREELRVLIAQCRADQKHKDDRRKQLRQWKLEVEEQKYLEDVHRARIMGKKIPERRKIGDSSAERAEAKILKMELEQRRFEESKEQQELTRIIFSTTLTEDEIPDKLYKVIDSDVKAQRPMSEEEKKRAAELDARRNEAGGENAPQRALNDFMGGVLKKTILKTQDNRAYEKESWMSDMPPRLMTKEQKKKLKDVEKAEEDEREGRLAQRRETLVVLKKLNAEIETLIGEYDAKLFRLSECRFLMDKVIERHNYLSQSILHGVVTEEIQELTVDVMGRRMHQLEKLREGILTGLTAMKDSVEKFQQIVEINTNLDAKEQRAFKKDFERLDGFEQLQLAYKKRMRKRKHNAGGFRPVSFPRKDYSPIDASICQANSVEDWLTRLLKLSEMQPKLEKVVEVEGLPVSAQLLGEVDPKDGELDFDAGTIERFIKYRTRKIFVEQKLKVAARILTAHEEVLKLSMEKDTQYMQELHRIKDYIARWQLKQIENGIDNHLTVTIPQGLVEAIDASLMSGLSSWVVFDRDLIEAYNQAILSAGQKNIHILNDIIKEYRQLRLLMWRGRKLTLQLEMAEADTHDVQLMRVTKDLQKVIKSGGSGNKVKEQMEFFNRKLIWDDQVFKKKLAEKEKALMKIQQDLKKFNQRNRRLEGQLGEMQHLVQRMHRISKKQDAKDATPLEDTMQILSQTKRLSNIAEIQKEDINVLRNELDRLQRKSFHMFDKAFDHREYVGPDVDVGKWMQEIGTEKQNTNKTENLRLPSIPK